MICLSSIFVMFIGSFEFIISKTQLANKMLIPVWIRKNEGGGDYFVGMQHKQTK